jgi:uncharacterized protein (TIGR01244 family)
MTLHFKWLSDQFAAAGQIAPADIAAVAAHGFRTIVNNRPDGEGGADQPRSEDLRKAAESAGLSYVYLPVVSGQMTAEQVMAMAVALRDAQGPVFAFCRSGARTEYLFQMTKRLG